MLTALDLPAPPTHTTHTHAHVGTRTRAQRVEFVDGTSAEFDVVAHCTGYHVSVPLLSEDVVSWTRPKPVPGDGEKSRGYPDLIQGAVPRRHKNLYA